MSEAITIKNISKQYPTFQLKDVSFSVPKGSIVGLVGENGAGKTTTIKAILGLIDVDQGEVNVLGGKVNKIDKNQKQRIGVVLDNSHFSQEFNANQINKILSHIYEKWDEVRFFELLERFELDAKKKIKEYSRGMKMKLSIIIALSHHCELLVMDEATSGLDPIVRNEILDMLMDFIQDEDCSILISSHILSDLDKVCDYIVMIHQGQVLLNMDKNDLSEEYALVHCTKQQLDELGRETVIAYQSNSFQTKALVYRKKLPSSFVCESISIEDIMLYLVKGDRL